MSQVMQATCPKCGQALRIPSQWANNLIRCKHCGQTLRAGGGSKKVLAAVPDQATVKEAAAPPADAPAEPTTNLAADAGPKPPPLPDRPAADSPFGQIAAAAAGPNPYVALLRQRRKKRRLITLAVVAVLAVGLGGAYLAGAFEGMGDNVRGLRDNIQQTVDNLAKTNKPAGNNPPVAEVPGAAKATGATPAKPSANANGRALLVGVKNYLFMTPLNPGYRPGHMLGDDKDPIGLTGLRNVLVKTLSFPADQVAELSDVATVKPYPPVKAAIQQNVEAFLAASRAQDKVVLAVTCHWLEHGGKFYLAPLEGEPGKPESLLPVEWLYSRVAECPAKQKLLILDLSPYDPERGALRTEAKPLDPKLYEQLAKVPENTLVWLSCSAGEHSYQFASNGLPGSVFLFYLIDCGTSIRTSAGKKNARWPEPKDAPPASLALLKFVKMINQETSTYVKERFAGAVQTPVLLGEDHPEAAAAPDGAAAKVVVQAPKEAEPLAATPLLEGIIKELAQMEDPSEATGAEGLPPFFAKDLADYKADYASEKELQDNLGGYPLRKATLEAAKILRENPLSMRTTFAKMEDAAFQKSLEREQETPAKISFELDRALEILKKAAKERDKEKSKRWRAHYDYVYARVLAKSASALEYNFVMGNKLKKDLPKLKNKESTGWALVPQEKPQEKDAKKFATERLKILDRLEKENPRTPWEILARRDRATNLGLGVQEAKVE